MPPGQVRPDLELVGIEKRFRGRQVLRGVTLAVQPGEFVAVLGPSGSGKSTLLKIAAGFEAPEPGGAVWLQGRDVTAEPPYRRNVNTVFQSYALFPHMSVFDNVAYGPRRRRMPGAEVKRRATEALALVGLADFGARSPETLSGGEQQRAALARALVNRPAVLLLDEPLSALDLRIRRRMQSELKRIHAETGTTFVFVTHDQEEALVLADRVVVMREGGLEQVGTAQMVYDEPATPFVADFVGEMNWLHGRLASGRVTLADGTVLRPPGRPVPDGPVRVGIRPERLRLAAAGTAAGPGENAIVTRVARVTFQGPNTRIEGQAAGGTMLTCLCPPGDAAAAAPLLVPGGEVACLWDVAATLIFAEAPPAARS